MIKKLSLLACLCGLFFANNAWAWQNEILFGYANSKEVQEGYNQSGFALTGKLYKFCPIDQTLLMTIDGSVSQWHASTKHDQNLTTIALAPSFRAYFMDPTIHCVRPYLGASFGPAYLSNKTFGERTQGANFAFQSTIEAGTEVGLKNKHSLDFNVHLVHYCNGGLFHPNQGITMLYLFSIGYQF